MAISSAPVRSATHPLLSMFSSSWLCCHWNRLLTSLCLFEHLDTVSLNRATTQILQVTANSEVKGSITSPAIIDILLLWCSS